MTINELHIQLDLYHENKINVLEDVARKCNEGYLFVDSTDGYCYLFDNNGSKDDVKKLSKIDNNLFYNSNIESIIIPDSVKWIGDSAFSSCKSLKSIVIHNLVESIGNYTFAYCENLKSIVIPDSVKSIGYWAFGYCNSLKSIEIPDLVEGVEYKAFAYCENLKSIIFKGKTIDQVEAMLNYPFGIEDESIIKCI